MCTQKAGEAEKCEANDGGIASKKKEKEIHTKYTIVMKRKRNAEY